MKLYYNKSIKENNLNIKELPSADNIESEVFDNEFFVVNLVIDNDEKLSNANLTYSVSDLASNLDKDNLPSDVRIVSVINNKDAGDTNIVLDDGINNIYIGIDVSYLGEDSHAVLDIAGTKADVHLKKNGNMLRYKGQDREDTLARLEWLNSHLFLNSKRSYVYDDINVENNILTFRGKKVELSADGYIKNVTSYIDDSFRLSDKAEAELLDGGIRFDINSDVKYGDMTLKQDKANVILNVEGESENAKVHNHAYISYEGRFDYTITVTAKSDMVLDAEETNSFSKYATRYMSGLGHNGMEFTPFHHKWNDKYQDSIFIGNVNVGARIKWYDEDYTNPYTLKIQEYKRYHMPETWNNGGNGGIDVLYEKERAKVTTYTGKIEMKAGDSKVFKYTILLTPFHEVNFKKHYNTRYYQNNKMGKTNLKKLVADAEKNKLNMIVLHKNNIKNPYLNYPMKNMENIRELVKDAHAKHIGVKLYYNYKDISRHANEIYAFMSARDHILETSNRTASNDWVKNNLGADKVVTDKVNYNIGDMKGVQDVGVLIDSDSRYKNYYVEMVNLLAKEYGIKGIHLEDNTIDRETMERVRKALDRYHGDIDLMIPYKNKYTETSLINNSLDIVPFVDSLLVGQGFNYKNQNPNTLLVDVSGLMYGVTSEIIEGNPFVAMLFGMTNRFGYNIKNNKKIHKLWDKFDIENSRMVGFWAKDALKAKDDGVKITYYVKDKKALICMFNFNDYPAMFTVDYSPLEIDGVMKSFPISKLIMNQKFTTKSTVVIYNKCGVFMLADLK